MTFVLFDGVAVDGGGGGGGIGTSVGIGVGGVRVGAVGIVGVAGIVGIVGIVGVVGIVGAGIVFIVGFGSARVATFAVDEPVSVIIVVFVVKGGAVGAVFDDTIGRNLGALFVDVATVIIVEVLHGFFEGVEDIVVDTVVAARGVGLSVEGESWLAGEVDV